MTWPTAELDPLRRLRVMAQSLPGVGLVETVLDAPFSTVWGFIEDLEHSVPAFDPAVTTLRIKSREGDRLVVVAGGLLKARFDAVLRDGWCWMHSRFYVVGISAVAQGDRTLYAHLEGLPQRGTGFLRPVMRQVVRQDIRGIRRALGLHTPGRITG